jgi:tRNA pseudouridine32 synthase/23S rRNA pseudouridine746 synthase
LPIRDGLNPTRLHLAPSDDWPTVQGYLLGRFPADRERLLAKLAAGEVVDGDGRPITADTPYVARTFVYLYRDPHLEHRVPFEVDILHRDERLLVVDKPHFLSTMPRGRYVVESALVRLRRDLELPTLSPAHRLDRVTAGVLMFTVDPAVRGAYQTVFARGEAHKEYEAVARFDPSVRLPVVVRSRIIKERGVPRAREVPGEPNAVSRVELLAAGESLARYRLLPRTGKTHQLRLHMNALGLPIVNDNFYPDLLDTEHDDYTAPLQLLARTLEFTDPISGRPRRFVSRRLLDVPLDSPASVAGAEAAGWARG